MNGSSGFTRTATRRSEGNVSRSNSTLFPAVSAAILEKPVMFPPGRAELCTSSGAKSDQQQQP